MKKVLASVLIVTLMLGLVGCGKPATPVELLKGSMEKAHAVKSRTDKVTVEFSTTNPDINAMTTGKITADLEVKTDTVAEAMSAVGSVKLGGMSFEMSMWATLVDIYFTNPIGEGYFTITKKELNEYLGKDSDTEVFTQLKDEFTKFSTSSNVYSLLVMQEREKKETITLSDTTTAEARVIDWTISTDAAYKLAEEFIVFAQNSTVFADYMMTEEDITLEEYKAELQESLDELKNLSPEDKALFEKSVASLKGVFYFDKGQNLVRNEITVNYVDGEGATANTSTFKLVMDTFNLDKTVLDVRPEVSEDLLIPLMDYLQ